MLNFLFNYKSILIKGGIILSILGSIVGYVFLLKVEIKDCQDAMLTKDYSIIELQKTITLLETNDWVRTTNQIIKTSSSSVFENIKQLQEQERKENDKNVTVTDDNILDGMFFQSNY